MSDMLPRGLAEFETWAKEIIELAGAPDNDSVRFALATMVLHLGTEDDTYPKEGFAKRLRKAMANQVVSQVINELKAKQEADRLAEQQALEAKQQEEATATSVADGSQV